MIQDKPRAKKCFSGVVYWSVNPTESLATINPTRCDEGARIKWQGQSSGSKPPSNPWWRIFCLNFSCFEAMWNTNMRWWWWRRRYVYFERETMVNRVVYFLLHVDELISSSPENYLTWNEWQYKGEQTVWRKSMFGNHSSVSVSQ